MPRAEHKTTPKIIEGYLYHDAGAIAVGSDEWYAWLKAGQTFYYEGSNGTFTARREPRRRKYVGSGYWYAYRRYSDKLHKTYLGKAEDLTIKRLAAVARRLDDKVNHSS